MRRRRESLGVVRKQLVTAIGIGWWCIASVAAAAIREGMPLREALLELQQNGLTLVFSTRAVRPELRVVTTPREREPRKILDELLAPHQLETRSGANGVLIIMKRSETSTASPPVRIREKIVVQPSRISLLAEETAAPVSLSREEIEALPHLGNDAFRALTLMPGAASTDLSAQFHLRGGRRDELLILLDGQELYEPYHLRDFDNALGIVDSSALARINLISAAFPVSYGDRMTGVIDMVTAAPPSGRTLRLSASMVDASIDAGGSLNGGAIGWLASVRHGTTDLLGRLFDLDEATFSDAFAKADLQITPEDSLRIRGLISADHLDTTNQDEFDPDEEPVQLETEYRSSYLWLTYRSILAEELFVDTTASVTHTQRDRRGSAGRGLNSVDDQRQLDVAGFVQSWNLQLTPNHFLNGGVEYQKYDATYDYFIDTPARSFGLEDRFATEHVSLYLSDRMRLGSRVTIEPGIRYDRHTAVDDNVVSPRVNAAWLIRPSSVIRVGWGVFSQSHRAYELMIEDGDPTFYPAERSHHSVIGFEHQFRLSAPVSSIRVEAYRRKVSNPRVRYENLLASFDRFAEARPDRVRIEPDGATAEGVELILRGRSGGRTDWWLNYAFAFTEDRIDRMDVMRSINQKHALNVDVSFRITPAWQINAAWMYHSGRPITPFTISGSELVFGAMNSDALEDYHRMDLRLSWEWRHLTLSVDAHNVYNHANPSGFDVRVDNGVMVAEPTTWPGLFVTAGVSWRFE